MPAPTQQGKVCIVCGKDCSQIDRIKDAEGRYTCKPCHEKAAGKPKAEPSIDALYDRPASRPCPQCDKPVAPDAEVCVACGYNLRAGKPVKTKLGKHDPSRAAVLDASSKRRAKPKLWVISGCAAGLLASAGWAGLTYSGGDGLAYLGVAVGLLTGIGVAAIAREHCGPKAAGVAAGLALLWCVLGKGAAAGALVLGHGPARPAPVAVNESLAQVILAVSVARTMTESGKTLYWPAGYTPQTAKQQDHFPPEVWQETARQWEANGPSWRAEYARAQQETLQFETDEKFAADRRDAFLAQFGWLDLAWGGAGVVLAALAGAGVHKLAKGEA